MLCVILILFTAQAIGSSGEMSEFTRASTHFTLDFFRLAYNQASDKNSVISPISIQSSLAMMYHVANENTSAEMQRVLGLPQAKAQAVENLQTFLNNANSKNAVKIVSKVYHAEQELNPNLLPILKGKYDTDVEAVNFTQPQSVADSANSWVDQVTNGMIKDFLNPDDLTDDDSLMLLNAVTLNVSWKLKFSSAYTKKRMFHFENGDHEIDMMYEDDDFWYGEVGDMRVLELPYETNSDLSMLIIMPKAGSLKKLIKTFNMKQYQELDESMNPINVIMKIPKFSISRVIQVSGILQSMGLSEVFEEGAFEIFTELKSKIAEIRQSAKIDVTEDGTSAAAVTEMRFVFLSAPMATVYFTVDRPFLYLIRSKSNKDIFFIGHYSHFEQ